MNKCLLAILAYQNEDLLIKCLKSLPKNIDTYCYFDGYKPEEEFKNLIPNLKNYVDNYEYANDHIGVCESWNNILNYAFNKNNYNVVIVLGSDLELKEGYIESYIEEFEKEQCEFSTGRGFGFSSWAITKKCYEIVGEFDLNFFPCYYEDNDYHTRIRISGLKNGDVGNHTLLIHYGSSTIRRNNKCQLANNTTFPINQKYYADKWGITNLTKIEEYKYLTPFNDNNLTIKDWKLDEEKYNYKKQVWSKVNE